VKALVTGASGFVGTHLVGHLSSEGDDVIGMDRVSGDPDLLDQEGLTAAFAAARPNAVYHLAGDADVGGSWFHAADTFRANAEGTLNVLAAAREAGVERVLVVGSADEYGRVSGQDIPINENQPLCPVSPYAASKVAAEYLAVQAGLGYGQEIIRARPFNHLGPGQTDRFIAPALAMRIARNEIAGVEVVPVGNLTPKRDFTDVRDVVRAYRLMMMHGQPGEVYNICSGIAIPVQELADRLIAMASRPMRLESDPELQRRVDIPVLCGDPSALQRATGWSPQVPLDTTLRDILVQCRAAAAAEAGHEG
jgi:GDP-4-dehydro-6-deoxy-D-mannose reductase